MARNNRMRQKNENYDRESYIDGNTVRWEQAVPAREIPERSPKPERTHREIMRDRERRQAARRNRQRVQAMNRGYVIFLAVATLVCAAVCVLFIHVQSNITTHMSEIATLQTELSDLKADNDAAENRMESTMTMDEIKARAGELGLVYPASGQIQHYTVDNDDYMNQY